MGVPVIGDEAKQQPTQAHVVAPWIAKKETHLNFLAKVDSKVLKFLSIWCCIAKICVERHRGSFRTHQPTALGSSLGNH